MPPGRTEFACSSRPRSVSAYNAWIAANLDAPPAGNWFHVGWNSTSVGPTALSTYFHIHAAFTDAWLSAFLTWYIGIGPLAISLPADWDTETAAQERELDQRHPRAGSDE